MKGYHILRIKAKELPGGYHPTDGTFRCTVPHCRWNSTNGMERTSRAAYKHVIKNKHKENEVVEKVVIDVVDANNKLRQYLEGVRKTIHCYVVYR